MRSATQSQHEVRSLKNLRDASSWIWLTFAVVLIAVVSAIGAFRPKPPLPLDVTSAQPNGALAAYLWLQRSGYHVNSETNPKLDLGALHPGRDAFMILRQTDLSSEQVGALLRWANAGGRIIVTTVAGTRNNLITALGLRTAATIPAPVSVDQPLLLAPAVRDVAGLAESVVRGYSTDVTVASAPSGPILLSRKEGSGRILVLSAPELLANDTIARADNRRLLLNLVGLPGASVSFDQAGPGAEPSQSQPNWLTSTNWGVAVLFSVVILFLFRWLSGLRLGPPIVASHEGHRPAAEYVVSMAGLLRRAHKRSDILNQYQQSLRRALMNRYGTAEPAWQTVQERDRLQRLLAPVRRLSEQELLRLSAAIVEYEDDLRKSGD